MGRYHTRSIMHFRKIMDKCDIYQFLLLSAGIRYKSVLLRPLRSGKFRILRIPSSSSTITKVLNIFNFWINRVWIHDLFSLGHLRGS